MTFTVEHPIDEKLNEIWEEAGKVWNGTVRNPYVAEITKEELRQMIERSYIPIHPEEKVIETDYGIVKFVVKKPNAK